MSVMHGPRKDKEYREQQYKLAIKSGIALLILVGLSFVANLIVGAGG